MKSTKFVSLLLLLSILGALLAACTPEPVKMENLPVYPGVQPSSDPNAAKLIESLNEQLKSSSPNMENIETKTYAIPKDTTWDAVEKYYTEQLSKDDWKSDPQLVFNEVGENEIHVRGWMRGKQVVAVLFVAMPVLNENVMGIVLGSVKE